MVVTANQGVPAAGVNRRALEKWESEQQLQASFCFLGGVSPSCQINTPRAVSLLPAPQEHPQSLQAGTRGPEQPGVHYVLSPNRAAATFPVASRAGCAWTRAQQLPGGI